MDHSSSIQTLDYVPCQTFDEKKNDDRGGHVVQIVKCNKSFSTNKLYGLNAVDQPCGRSTRKLSSKEKYRRQKDAERVEKLRLLVSYLRSGSSQPVVSPVALEADEIELAERYKLHMALRDDLLNLSGESESNTQHQTMGHFALTSGEYNLQNRKSPDSSLVVSSNSVILSNNNNHYHQAHLVNKTASVIGTTNTSPSASSCSMSHHHRNSVGVINYLGCNLGNGDVVGGGCSGGGGGESSGLIDSVTNSLSTNDNQNSSSQHNNVDNSCNKKNNINNRSAAPTVSATRSIPQIGQVSWVLRHSISDPGNKFGHNFASLHSTTITDCGVANHYSSTSGARSSIASALWANNQHQHDQESSSIGQFSPKISAISVGQVYQNCLPVEDSKHQRASSCRTTSSYANSYSNNQNNSYSSSSSSIIHNQQIVSKQPARLFYIDDIDAPQQTSNLPIKNFDGQPQHFLMSTPNASAKSEFDLGAGGGGTLLLTQAKSSCNLTNSICSSNGGQSMEQTAAGYDSTKSSATTNGGTLTSSRSCSAWTNPQNLATWIDNEVNSLVHDLEVNESQQQKHSYFSKKHNTSASYKSGEKATMSRSSCKNKEGKRKWLSVTGANLRRNSSGARST